MCSISFSYNSQYGQGSWSGAGQVSMHAAPFANAGRARIGLTGPRGTGTLNRQWVLVTLQAYTSSSIGSSVRTGSKHVIRGIAISAEIGSPGGP